MQYKFLHEIIVESIAVTTVDQCIVAGQQVWNKFIHEVSLR